MRKTVKEIAELIGGTVQGDNNLLIEGITGLDMPKKGMIAFANNKKRLSEAEDTPLACIIAPKGSQSSKKTLIITDNPKISWAHLLRILHPSRKYIKTISDNAFIAKTAKIAPDARIEPFAYIGERAVIGRGSVIRAFAYIDNDVTVGNETIIHPNTSIYDHTQIGNHVIIHCGAIIGSDGFGYVMTEADQKKIPQVGNVIIEDDVEIGSCATVDRATVGSTIIKKGVKIDNLVQVAHNVEVGEFSAVSAQAGISGSSKIGKGVILAGQVGISDHCEIGDGAIVGAQAGIPTAKKVPPKTTFFGSPARPYSEMKRQLAAQMKVADTIKKVHQLEKKIKELEEKLKEVLSKP